MREVKSKILEQSAMEVAAAEDDDAGEEEMDEEEASSGKRQRGSGGGAIKKPEFAAMTAQQASGGKSEFRRVPVPPHRYTPLRKEWMQIYTPIVQHLKLDVRMNPRNRSVEIKTSKHTDDVDTLQKAADFVRAYLLGFDVTDAVALLRVEDLFVDTFQVTDVKILKGDHLSRAIGRVAGKDGKCKYAIENATKTRIILAESRVHILGSFANIKMARDVRAAPRRTAPHRAAPRRTAPYTRARTPLGRCSHARAPCGSAGDLCPHPRQPHLQSIHQSARRRRAHWPQDLSRGVRAGHAVGATRWLARRRGVAIGSSAAPSCARVATARYASWVALYGRVVFSRLPAETGMVRDESDCVHGEVLILTRMLHMPPYLLLTARAQSRIGVAISESGDARVHLGEAVLTELPKSLEAAGVGAREQCLKGQHLAVHPLWCIGPFRCAAQSAECTNGRVTVRTLARRPWIIDGVHLVLGRPSVPGSTAWQERERERRAPGHPPKGRSACKTAVVRPLPIKGARAPFQEILF